MNHVEVSEGLEVAIEALLEVSKCEFYARIYMGVLLSVPRSTENDLQPQNQSTVDSRLPELYAAVIVFAVKARTYFEAKGMHFPYSE